MKCIRTFFSNRLENLVEELNSVISIPLSSPMEEEIIVVQSAGMERWISMRFARRHGVCANFKFYFPNTFIQDIFRKLIPDIQEPSPFDPKIMTWRIMKLLQSFIKTEGFESISYYLGKNRGNLKCFQLAERIADTFDQYQLFRPEMIFRWESNKENHWQAMLWRELIKGREKMHRAALGNTFLKEANKLPGMINNFPARISVFGISALPEFYLQLFNSISRFTEVNLFLMNPSREYWGDIISELGIAKKLSSISEQDIEELYFEKGNGILASMGALGRDFFEAINEFEIEEHTIFQEPGEDNLLSCIQSDILNLRDRKKKTGGNNFIKENDDSIKINSCHSPMREIEVLHDWLLNMFEKNTDLMPADILVMAPDIESYAPYIQAVFDMKTDNPAKIPFTIADQGLRRRGKIIDTFLAILDLANSRFSAPEVLSIFESQAVYQAFALSEADLDLIRNWTRETRIRWGIDGPSKEKEGLPPFQENTWRAGIDRLLLGYALPGKDEKIFEGVLPFDHIEGHESITLGKFIEFTDRLFTHVSSLGKPRKLNEWSETLLGLLNTLFTPDIDTETEIQELRQVIGDLSSRQEMSKFNEDVGIDVIKWHIDHSLANKGYGFGFLTGGVTFCAMLPMRSIPSKIICLIGMNNDAYPRQNKPVGFDLIAKNPKPGDRSRRNDDRYLFLEALLSARKTFYISYIGQNIKDNSVKPPSVLVNELIDYIIQGFFMKGRDIMDHIFTKHRLQAFNPAYFMDNEKLRSYSEENYDAARTLLKTQIAPTPFISGELNELGPEWRVVDLDDLCRFFGNPAKYLLNKRLGIKFLEEDSPLEGSETFEINKLNKYLIAQDMLRHRIEGKDKGGFFHLIRASGRLPHGKIGESVFEEMNEEIDVFLKKILPYTSKTPLEPLKIDLTISGFKITGQINSIYQDRLIQYRYGRVRPKDRLRIWIYHLIISSIKDKKYPCISMLAGLSPNSSNAEWEALEYEPVEKGEEIIGKLLEKYWEGLRRPIHFFPKSSWTYAFNLLGKNKPQDYAMNMASREWLGGNRIRGESEDPYCRLCFAISNPIDSEFEQISKDVFDVLLMHQKKI
jgi:exodeoxyribonuclease V gamma subunit